MRTALSCWNFFSSRGSAVVRRLANVDSGTSLSSEPVMYICDELIGRQPLRALDLRNDLVAPALDAEAVDVVAAEQRRQILAGLAQIDALRAELVAIEDDLGLRLIELQVGVGEDEQAARERLLHELVRELAKLLRLGRPRRSRDRPGNLRRRAAAAASAESRGCRESATAAPSISISSCSRRLGPLAPRLGHHAAEAAGRKRELKDAGGLGERLDRPRGPARRTAWSDRSWSSRTPGGSRTPRPDPRRARAPAARTCRTAPSAAATITHSTRTTGR